MRQAPLARVQARLHALALCELLLPRSRAFRAVLAQHFPAFLERAIGFRAARPLPGPADVALQLRERALEATERWAEDYGAHYQQVQRLALTLCKALTRRLRIRMRACQRPACSCSTVSESGHEACACGDYNEHTLEPARTISCAAK